MAQSSGEILRKYKPVYLPAKSLKEGDSIAYDDSEVYVIKRRTKIEASAFIEFHLEHETGYHKNIILSNNDSMCKLEERQKQ